MKDQIKMKLDERVKEILEKPHISNEDYALLREKLSEMPNDSWDPMWLLLLIMMLSGFGGGKK
jgi:hypothetical protein